MAFSVKSGFVRLALLGPMSLLAGAAVASPVDPSGTWLTQDGRARIRVEACGPTGANMCGYVVWMKAASGDDGQPKVDARNPDPAKASRPVLGHQLMMGLKAASDDTYQGQIYNNEDGKSYSVSIWLASENGLKVKGCLIAFLCSTQDWTRATGTLPGQLVAATGLPGGPRPDPEWASKTTGSTGAAKPAAHRDAKPKS